MSLNGLLQSVLARTRALEILPGVLTLLFTVAIAFRVAELTWRVVPVSELQETVPAEVSTVSQPVRAAAVETSVSQWSLFGKVEVAPVAQIDEPIEVPETRLNLTLLGVIASTSKSTAKAIISDPSGNEDYYSVGMPVPGGATVDEIFPDHVMLRRNNRLEVLRLPQDEELGSMRGASGMQYTPDTPSRRPLAPSMSADNRSTGAMLRQYREQLNQDPQSVFDLVRAEPFREGDRLVGYRISPGRDRQLLSRFGLRSGDVVTAVNGLRLDNPMRGLEIMQNLQTASQVSVEVIRNGVTQNFSFTVE
jgi:general secretion pathway protein C